MSDGQKIGGKATIPVKEMALANLDKIFPHLTAAQIEALRSGAPVPPSPNWNGSDRSMSVAPDAKRIARRLAVCDASLAQAKNRLPSVTAIMVFSDANRVRRARKAVNQFVAQSYPNKQIVIVNASNTPITNVPHNNVLELQSVAPASTGELRNIGLKHAVGDLVFPFWDDDDVYDYELLSFLVSAHVRGKATLLTTQVRVDIEHATAYMHVEPYGIPNTVLCPTGMGIQFADRTGGEDYTFVQPHWALKTNVVDNKEWPVNSLLMRVHAGDNVTPRETFMAGHHSPEFFGRWDLGKDVAEYMTETLEGFGLKAEARLPQEALQPLQA